jgi:diaminohydroxyphosphoribosylaminopyrimidine deaminase/5-amino-6-(5-phosphoribosylamino)uracil reductase
MVGAGTVLADNPRLTCRTALGRDPVRVVVDARLRTAPGALGYRERSSAPAIVVTTRANAARARRRYGGGRVEVLAAPSRGGQIDLQAVMREFARRGWCKVLIEGGARLAATALAARIVDRVAFFIAPKLVGSGLGAIEGLATRGIRDSIALADLRVRRIGADLLVEARPVGRRVARG